MIKYTTETSPYLTATTLKLLMRLEGCSLKAYRCSAGKWTIGYGHTGGVQFGDEITKEEALKLLEEDVKKVIEQVREVVTVPLNPNQFGALVLFTYNLGIGSLKRSILLQKVNEEDWEGAFDAFTGWTKVKGKLDKGIAIRRGRESMLFMTPPELHYNDFVGTGKVLRQLIDDSTDEERKMLEDQTFIAMAASTHVIPPKSGDSS